MHNTVKDTVKNTSSMQPRQTRELKTVKAMIEIYCCDNHRETTSGLCEDCGELAAYAEKRLVSCPFQQDKPSCGKCTIHCYKPDMKQRIIDVMRYSGPRMILHHPILAIAHLLDEKLIKAPVKSTKQSSPSTSKKQRS